jgi:hypothetical protein
MHLELKKQITIYVFDNINNFQLNNATTENFREYIYNSQGNYLIGGKEVSEFITNFINIIKK